MAKQFDHINEDQRAFIEEQPIFFTGTAGPEGRVNVSPKGMDSLRVLGPNRILWLNWTGSGNETAAHLMQVNRMTIMWCSFGKRPLILRTYGTARTIHEGDAEWGDLLAHFDHVAGARQIYDVSVDLVQSSCGFAVPYMENPRERDTLSIWAEKKGRDGVRDYWAERNTRTIDGEPTDFA